MGGAGWESGIDAKHYQPTFKFRLGFVSESDSQCWHDSLRLLLLPPLAADVLWAPQTRRHRSYSPLPRLMELWPGPSTPLTCAAGGTGRTPIIVSIAFSP